MLGNAPRKSESLETNITTVHSSLFFVSYSLVSVEIDGTVSNKITFFALKLINLDNFCHFCKLNWNSRNWNSTHTRTRLIAIET